MWGLTKAQETELLEKMREMMEENCKKMVESIKEDNRLFRESISRSIESTIEDGRKFRERLRKEREQSMEQSSQKIEDNEPQTEELPEDENMEQVSPKPEDGGEKETQIIKKMEERRIIRPKKTRVTKELIEMTRSGLINMINFPVINREEGIYRKEYRRSFRKMDEEKKCATTKKTINVKVLKANISKGRIRHSKKRKGYQEQQMCIRDSNSVLT